MYLVVKHEFSSCIWFVQVIQIVQHGWIGKHKVHDFMTKQSTELGNNLKKKKNMIHAQENLRRPQRILENPRWSQETPENPRETQRNPEKPRETQRNPKNPDNTESPQELERTLQNPVEL